jgi:RNA polymerase sigma-70 factor (ECF subfamily)
VRSLERPAAWAVRVARNLLANRAKRRAIERRARRDPLPPAPAADAAAREEEMREAIAGALAALPESEREAVAMKIWGELTWLEIGRALEVSEDAAARLFARGLRALAPRLGEFAP